MQWSSGPPSERIRTYARLHHAGRRHRISFVRSSLCEPECLPQLKTIPGDRSWTRIILTQYAELTIRSPRASFPVFRSIRRSSGSSPRSRDLPDSGTHHGSEAVIKEIFEPTLDKFDDFRLQCDQFLDAGDQVVVTGRFLGRGKDTGSDLDATFAHVWTLRNGKVVRFQDYTDTANWLRALYHVHLEQPLGAHR